jgi:hypothetical protein
MSFMRPSLMPKTSHADGVAVGVDVGLLGGHARGAHARVGQHQRQHVVGQRLLQVDVAARHALGDAAADEVVVHHLVQRVGFAASTAPAARRGRR